MSIEDGDDQKRVKVPSISSAFIYEINQAFELVEVPKGRHEHPMRPSLWRVKRKGPDGTVDFISQPCIKSYAQRDLNAVKFTRAFSTLEDLMGGDFPHTHNRAWENVANFDEDNVGYPYQAYYGNWLKVLRSYIQQVKEQYHEEYY